ncbi:MAG: YqeG family HAD IIIA-type phosphatase [Cyanobacteriota bacterium]|nr:YqeG family HAD IIIA-type phosphatase [Cyanobacteriota bacterium]
MSQHWLQPNWEPGLTLPHLPIQHLLDQGLQALILDVDRTLLPGREIELPLSVTSWVKEAQRHLLLHLFSNNPSRKRIGSVAEQLDLTFTCSAAKPRRARLRKVLNQIQCKPTEIAIVGDRIFTDVLAGNRLDLYTVLVRPLRADGYPCNNNRVQRLEQKLAAWLGAPQT